MKTLLSNLSIGLLILIFSFQVSADVDQLFMDGANRLTSLQNNDGGWDWELDDGDPTSTSPPNTIAPISMGLARAYLSTGEAEHLAALTQAGAFLLAKTNAFSSVDGYMAVELDRIFGGTTYRDHVKTNFYDQLDAGTYNHKGYGTLYNAETFVLYYRNARAAQGIPNLAAWDTGLGLVGAAAAGANTAAWIQGVKAEINELDGTEEADHDVIGLAGAIYGLAYVNEEFDPTTGEHAAAGSVRDLTDILLSYQIDCGGFAHDSNFIAPDEYNEGVQVTTYALLAMDQVNSMSYRKQIKGAENFLMDMQLSTGGWGWWNGTSYNENNEYTGEALWAVQKAETPTKPDWPVCFITTVFNP